MFIYFCNHRYAGGDYVVGGRKKENWGHWLHDRLCAAYPGARREDGGETLSLKCSYGWPDLKTTWVSVSHTLEGWSLRWPRPRGALLDMGIIPCDQINLHPNLPFTFHAMISRLLDQLSFCCVGWETGAKKLWLTCGTLMSWTPALTDWLFSLFLFFCLSTQAMQVKVQVKCMTCLFLF